MASESKFFDLDETAWTAIAAIIALALGLYGAFWLKFLDWLRKPVLALEFGRMAQHSERMGDFWCLRVPVSNREGKNPATQIEIFLESIQEVLVQQPIELPAYLPIRLRWCHGDQGICDRLAGGAYRLLNLGALTFTINSQTSFVEAVKARITDANPVAMGFSTEVEPLFNRIGLPVGTYRITFLIASDSTSTRQTVTLTVRNQHLQAASTLADFVIVAT